MTRSNAVSSLLSSVLLGGVLLAVPSVAHAQSATTTSTTTSTTTTTAGGTDHSQVVGTFGVGYMGLGGIAISNGGTGAQNIDAPIIGVRYWLNDGMGIDAGIGFGYSSGSTTVKSGSTTVDTDRPAATGFLLHGGVPLALASGQHHTFQIVPELNLGYGSQTVKAPAGSNGDDTKNSGFRLDIGARAGTEVQFGFIGLPNLALQATVGVYFSYQSITTKTGDNNETSASATSLSTSVQSAPWAIFTNNISALYYF